MVVALLLLFLLLLADLPIKWSVWWTLKKSDPQYTHQVCCAAKGLIQSSQIRWEKKKLMERGDRAHSNPPSRRALSSKHSSLSIHYLYLFFSRSSSISLSLYLTRFDSSAHCSHDGGLRVYWHLVPPLLLAIFPNQSIFNRPFFLLLLQRGSTSLIWRHHIKRIKRHHNSLSEKRDINTLIFIRVLRNVVTGIIAFFEQFW